MHGVWVVRGMRGVGGVFEMCMCLGWRDIANPHFLCVVVGPGFV